jgi:hypothetical protein
LLQIKQALLASSSIFQYAVGLLDQQKGMAQASSCFKAVLQMQHAHMQLALQCVLHLQTLKTPRMQSVLSSLAVQELAAALGLETMLVTSLGAALELSNNNSSTTSGGSSLPSSASARSSAAAGTPSAAAAAGAAAAALKAGSVQWSAFVQSMQQEMLQAVEILGAAALAAAAAQQVMTADVSASSTCPSAVAEPAGSAKAVQDLLKKLPEVWDSVQQDAAAEMAEVLQTLFNAECSLGYGSMVSFMRGHLHQCPKGHYFVIGECGGAMQESQCVECGAVVGGRSHQLAAGNQRANEDVLQQLHEGLASARQ